MPPKKVKNKKSKTIPQIKVSKNKAKTKNPTNKIDNSDEPLSKKAKKDDQNNEVSPSKKTKEDIIKELKSSGNIKKHHHVDQYCKMKNLKVMKDYDCMLNQTNIQNNNNKFYVIQLLEGGNKYYVYTRWGRVGEIGAINLSCLGNDINKAIIDFKKKFKSKTNNDWSKRNQFKAISGKYTLMQLEDEDDSDGNLEKMNVVKPLLGKNIECKLDKETQKLIKLIFDNDMFNEEMKNMNIDIKKMPLGKISKAQIAKAFEILDEIEMALKNNKKSQLDDLSSKFYTLIPHNFGRQRPPTIQDEKTLQLKMDLLSTLGDIEIAQSLQDIGKLTDINRIHPLDASFSTLDCDLELLDMNSHLGKKLQTYFINTTNPNMKILQIWQVNRHSEGSRFQVNNAIENRKLLWHGTKLAVVAAILKGGLRIMPHSGGLVGRGIYFASENAKSANYTSRSSDNIGVMFLNEVALGNEYSTFVCRSDLKVAPKGHDSVVARGNHEPDPKKDVTINLDGKKVSLPQGKPVKQELENPTGFRHSEYLIYKEHQCRIRFILTIKF